MTQHLYVTDAIETFDPTADSTFAFMLEGQKRGIENWVCQPKDLVLNSSQGFAYAHTVKVMLPEESGGRHFVYGTKDLLPFDDCAVIWMRKDPPVDLDFISACMILSFANESKTLLMNRPSSLLVANEKLFGAHYPSIFANTSVMSKMKTVVESIRHYEKAVIKPLFGAGGHGIFVLSKNDPNLQTAVELLTNHGKTPVMVQEYLEGIKQGDKRLLLLGGEPIGAVLRVPQGKDHRANLHVGGKAVKADITNNDRKIAQELKPKLLELGLHFVGLDIIDNKVTEINVTSPTGVQEIDRLNELDENESLAAQVIEYTAI